MIGKRSLDGTSSIVCYWKNGDRTDLTDRNTYATDQAITVSGNDIYMSWSATYNAYGKLQTSYSKNFGTPVTIADGTQDARGYAIAVSGSDVYIAGSGPAANSQSISAKYWKNGNAVTLANNTNGAFALSVAVLDQDIYVAGYSQTSNGSLATYWKNGKAVSITDGTSDALIRKIVVLKK